MIESGGSGSHGSIRRKRGVNAFSKRICAIPNVRRFINLPLSHHAGTPRAIKLQKSSPLKSRLTRDAGELIFGISAVMSQHFIQAAEEFRTERNQDDCCSAVCQSIIDISQSADVVREVFNDIQADNPCRNFDPWGKTRRSAPSMR